MDEICCVTKAEVSMPASKCYSFGKTSRFFLVDETARQRLCLGGSSTMILTGWDGM